jgi:hypothetical protein
MNHSVPIEIEPGDRTHYRFSVTAVQCFDRYGCTIDKWLWFDIENDRFILLDWNISDVKDLQVMEQCKDWNPVTLAVLAELHKSVCSHFRQTTTVIREDYVPHFYDWLTHCPIERTDDDS